MERVAAGLSNDIDDTARVLTIFSVVVAGLDAEFLERVWKRKWLVDVGVFVDIIAAVEHEVRIGGARTVYRHGNRRREGLGQPLIRIIHGAEDYTSNELRQLSRVSSIERQIIHTFSINDLRQSTSGRIHLDGIRNDHDGLGWFSKL